MISVKKGAESVFNLFFAEIKVQYRSGLYAAYAVMTLFFLLILFLLPAQYRTAGFGVIILMDPSFMGAFFGGGLILLEQDQGVLSVFLTRGRGFASYWIGKASAILALAFTVVIFLTIAARAAGLINPDFQGLLMIGAGLVLTVPVFLSLGLMLAGRFPDIIQYFIYSGIFSMPLMIPLVELFGISTGWVGALSPVWGGMVLITSGFHEAAAGYARSSFEIAAAVLCLSAWNIIAYKGASRSFSKLASGQSAPAASVLPAGAVAPAAPAASLIALLSADKPDNRQDRSGRFAFEFSDLLLMLRDPVTLLLLAAPLLISFVLGRVFPWIAGSSSPFYIFLPSAVTETIPVFKHNAGSLALLLSPLMYGMIGAFLFLDEKDSSVLPFLQTVPEPEGWFLLRRCRMLLVLYAFILVPSLFSGNLVHGSRIIFALSLIIDALALPMIFLAIGILADSKVQGLALAKVLNICCLPPVFIAALPGPWVWLTGVFPTAWGSLLRLEAEGLFQISAAVIFGILYSGAVIAVLFRKVEKTVL